MTHNTAPTNADSLTDQLSHRDAGKPSMITTIDNPYNPFTHYDEWLVWDEAAGYYTNSYLARVANYSNELSEADQDLAIDDAIDEIVQENILGVYRRVYADK